MLQLVSGDAHGQKGGEHAVKIERNHHQQPGVLSPGVKRYRPGTDHQEKMHTDLLEALPVAPFGQFAQQVFIDRRAVPADVCFCIHDSGAYGRSVYMATFLQLFGCFSSVVKIARPFTSISDN